MAISNTELIAKMGKQGFVEFAEKNQYRGERQGDIERRRSRGKAKWKMCGHGVVLLDNYEPTGNRCDECKTGSKRTEGIRDVDYRGYNVGLGVYTDGYSDFKRACKESGMIHVGTDKLR